MGICNSQRDPRKMQNQKAHKRRKNGAFSNIDYNDIVVESHTTVKLKTSKIVRLLDLIRDRRLTESLVLLNQVGIPDEAGLLIISLLQRVMRAGR